MRLHNQTIDPSQLDEPALEALTDELYAVQREVFDGVERASFAAYVLRSTAEVTHIDVQRSADGRAVGYLAVHVYERSLGGRPCVIVRAEAGTLRAFRGRTNVTPRFVRLLLPHLLRNLHRPVLYLGAFVHPSSYRAFARFAAEIWPHPTRETPPEMLQLMCGLADSFGLPLVNPERPLVRQVGWITRDSEAEQAWWERCELPDVAFFVRANPGYPRGDGLITLVPAGARQILRGVARLVVGRFNKLTDRLKASAQQLTGMNAPLQEGEVEAMLRSQSLLQEVPHEVIAAMAEAAQVRLYSRGQVLFHRHDRGESMYLVLAGSVFVLLEDEGHRDVLLNQLGVGQIFGEQALLSGEPRTATVRAATALRLLEVRREELDRMAQRVPVLADTLWKLFGERMFLTHSRLVSSLAELPGATLHALYESAVAVSLTSAGHAQLAPGVYFLLLGTVELEQPGAQLSITSPALLRLSEPSRVKGTTAARLVRLDPRLLPP